MECNLIEPCEMLEEESSCIARNPRHMARILGLLSSIFNRYCNIMNN